MSGDLGLGASTFVGGALFNLGRFDEFAGDLARAPTPRRAIAHPASAGDVSETYDPVTSVLKEANLDAFEAFWQKAMTHALAADYDSFQPAFDSRLPTAASTSIEAAGNRRSKASRRRQTRAACECSPATPGRNVLLASAYMGDKPAVLALLGQKGLAAAPQPAGRSSLALLRPMMRAPPGLRASG